MAFGVGALAGVGAAVSYSRLMVAEHGETERVPAESERSDTLFKSVLPPQWY